MIDIKEKTNCCGCTACQQICPHGSIIMREDEQGFKYPEVDKTSCVECHLCEKVCPVLNRYTPKEQPLKCYLAKTPDERLRAESSSGGIFTVFATAIIKKGGVVFCVRFDKNWQPEYGFTESVESLGDFRGSKYVQADLQKTYKQVLSFLKQGRIVLFTGNPCFVSGLNHFLRKNYDNLLTLDFVCHSIPSPMVWRSYLSELEQKERCRISHVTFRDKSNGWTDYSIRIDLTNENNEKKSLVETHDENIYMRGFLHDLYTRPSCSACPARNYTSGSDVTLADAWHINKYHPEKNDEKGISHVLINTEKGLKLYEQILPSIDNWKIDYSEVEPNSVHAPLTRSSKAHRYRASFYKKVKKGCLVIDTAQHYLQKEERRRQRNMVIRKSFIVQIIYRLYKYIKFS
jgi:coenzyme F420-reducing hydrogenase beta subunit